MTYGEVWGEMCVDLVVGRESEVQPSLDIIGVQRCRPVGSDQEVRGTRL
jgi:hypothetical protein